MFNNYNQHVPEFMTQDYGGAGSIVRKMKFSVEDEEKMSRMSLDERYEYRKKLIESGQYTYEVE